MSTKKKLIICGVVVGCITAAVLASTWNSMANSESSLFAQSDKPATAANYVQFANDAASSSLPWRIMYHSPTMQAHLKQRMREAAAYEATLPTDGQLRTKMREDYVNTAETLDLDPAMATAMLALIDDANAHHEEIPLKLTVTNKVETAGDSDLQLLLSTNTGGRPWFDLGSPCSWDQRLHAEHLRFSTLGVDQPGIVVEVTLKDVPGLLELTNVATGGVEQRVRRFGATVEVTVAPSQGIPVRATREEDLSGFSLETTVKVDPITRDRIGGPISIYTIYNEEIRTLAGKACYGGARPLGTTEVP